MRKCLGNQSQNLMTFAALDKLNYLSLQERKGRHLFSRVTALAEQHQAPCDIQLVNGHWQLGICIWDGCRRNYVH